MNVDDSISTRETLLDRLRQWDDHASWQEFFDIYWRLIFRFAVRAGLNEEEAREVVQDTVIAAARNMPGFKYEPHKCAFKTWLLNVTKWRIVDQIRKRAKKMANPAAPTSGASELESLADPNGCELESIWDREWEDNLVQIAADRVKKRVPPKQYQMFYLHALKELPVSEVAARVGSSVAAVYLAKHRVGRVLRRELKQLQAESS